ncbi:helix-turn-helix domain-containing protein [Methylosarcina fibrata]|uniref:helix-turn-helix domain-containing protein n=1 Tax=Methylosarcina fibrata TaxID=105972 RepID=UPI0012F9E3D9|nr:helix-turn-helix domain-containing protein [Methylosarcina fibrata]
MPALKYKVNLTEDEKRGLEAMINKGKAAARHLTRARILLKAAAGIQDKDIIQALGVSESMVLTTRQRCVEEGPEAALKERPRPGRCPKTDGEAGRPILSPWLVVRRRQGMITGPCGLCWRTKWWN